jgi:hypothetical protein
LHLLPSNQLSGLGQQHFENLDGLALQLQADSALAQFRELRVQFEGAEANFPILTNRRGGLSKQAKYIRGHS